MEVTLTQQQLDYIYHYDKTHSITTACNLAVTLVEQVLQKQAQEAMDATD